MQNPRITLIGAGPGDPELLTLKALRALQSAEVVLYDALVTPEILEWVPETAHKIPVGKRAGKASAKQEDINRLLVEMALVHGHAVRLKGGDAMLFARGSEEWAYAAEAGIPVSVIPGISSLQLPGLYGIPLTARGINTGFRVVTATNRFGELTPDVQLAAEDG
ncbi:MAG TPA: uroporphyrinogen-III C-methyltransferase, partial [Cytophagales bacterium]|nr:uroporphyrinogen-III C-methyltransferase [Cytophagales bacterium]